MNEAILTVVMFLYSVFDQRGDALNSGAYKWPNSGFQVGWWVVRLAPGYVTGPDQYRNGFKVWKTFDRWHWWKWSRFYLPPVYILTLTLWPSLLPQWWGFIPATALATIAWKLLPTPDHWKA